MNDTLAQEDLLGLWRTMVRIRAFEECVQAEARAGRVPGHVHLSLGQEAVAAGVSFHLERDDVITTTHRGHGHAIAKGVDATAMMAEILGRANGCCGGKGGSMHIADAEHGLLSANGIVGANAPLAVGAALSARQLGERRIAVAWIGDGASNQGAVFESLNLAAAFALPCLFVIEDNGYGEYTPRASVTGTDDLAARIRGFGLPASHIDGSDIFAVEAAARTAIARIREGEGPAAIVAEVVRFSGHFEGDTQTYRPSEEVAAARRERDPLSRFRRRVLEAGWLDAATLDAIAAAARNEMAAAAMAAHEAPSPPAETLLRDVSGEV
ncbi:MAG: thiamine pyrophosphate-dependent dehydrogenase E1 component subunit alpha [Alphaproteobacteria bacterium]|nr:MAG: thiamine pyrophosphate-dependent dehydrogenase E1 component subunit alpha [Alphaproteobacteria bacterium]